MGTVLYTILVALAGLVVGLVAPIWFWRRQLWRLDLMWRMNFANCVNQSIAQFFGGRVEDGVIYLPGHGPGECNEDPSKKLN